MKLSFKHLVAAAVLAATSAAHATSERDWSVTSGTAAIAFSFNGLDAINSLGAIIVTNPTIPFVRDLPGGGQVNTANYVKSITTINLSLTGGTTAGDALTAAQSSNSVVQFKRTTLDQDDQVNEQSVFLTNLGMDLASSTIYANVYTWDRYTPVPGDFSRAISHGRLAAFSFDKAAGVTGGNIIVDSTTESGLATGHASSSSTDSLRLNSHVADLFLAGLGLNPASGDDLVQRIRLRSWGTLSVDANVTAVPEPSTQALTGLGLLGLLAIRRFGRRPS